MFVLQKSGRVTFLIHLIYDINKIFWKIIIFKIFLFRYSVNLFRVALKNSVFRRIFKFFFVKNSVYFTEFRSVSVSTDSLL